MRQRHPRPGARRATRTVSTLRTCVQCAMRQPGGASEARELQSGKASRARSCVSAARKQQQGRESDAGRRAIVRRGGRGASIFKECFARKGEGTRSSSPCKRLVLGQTARPSSAGA